MGRSYSPAQLEAMESGFPEMMSTGDHMREVIDAATDDVKSVVEPVTDAIGEVVRSTTRDVAFFIAGGVFTLVVIVIAHFI